MNETHLVRRARRGDADAWEALVAAHEQPVFRLAYLLLGDADEAQDTAQETFIRAYGALARFDDARPLRPWLMRIAANTARNHRRAFGRHLAALTRLARQEPAQADGPPAEIEQAHTSARMWSAIQRLAPGDQHVIYLRWFLELPVEETAQALGVAEGTVKSRLHRALASLRTVIERDFPDLREEETTR